MTMTIDKQQADKPRINLSSPDPLATINRSQAARALSINVSNVSRFLTPIPEQRRIPHIHTFYRLAQYLNLTMDQLYELLYKPR